MIRRSVALVLVLALALLLPSQVGAAPAAPPGPSSARIHAGPPRIGPGSPVEPRRPASGSQVRLIVSTTDQLAMPNDGLRLNVTPFVEPPLAADTSFQASVEEIIGSDDAVFGLFANTGTAPIPFFSVFSNTTDNTLHLAYWPTATTAPGTTYDFELSRTNGTVWTLDVNGAIFGGNTTAGQFDFGADEATWLAGLSFSEIALSSTSTSAPSTFSTPLTFAVLQPAGWYLPSNAEVSFSPSAGAAWGIEGRLQHPTLAPGEMVSGTSIATVPNGTQLWSGGRIAVQVVVDAPTAAQGLTTVGVPVSVTTTSGAPIPGATVYLADALGGTFTPASVVTGMNGSVVGAFSAPNVTSAASDLLSAVVTTFGYEGYTDVSVQIAPAAHVVVRDLTSGPRVGPDGSIVLSFGTENASGTLLAGVFLTFDASAGSLSPTYGLTGADGSLTTTLTAPNSTGFVTVRAVVEAGGEWGGTFVNVSIAAPPSPLFSGTLVDAAAGIVLVAIVVGLAFALRRRASRRPPVPPMRLPRPAQLAPRAPADPDGGAGSPANRTQPGSDAP
jgi:hypothetical protein